MPNSAASIVAFVQLLGIFPGPALPAYAFSPSRIDFSEIVMPVTFAFESNALAEETISHPVIAGTHETGVFHAIEEAEHLRSPTLKVESLNPSAVLKEEWLGDSILYDEFELVINDLRPSDSRLEVSFVLQMPDGSVHPGLILLEALGSAISKLSVNPVIQKSGGRSSELTRAILAWAKSRGFREVWFLDRIGYSGLEHLKRIFALWKDPKALGEAIATEIDGKKEKMTILLANLDLTPKHEWLLTSTGISTSLKSIDVLNSAA